MPSAICEKASELESFNFIGIAGSRFHGLAGRGMADCSGAQEQRMSGGLTTATRRQKKSSYLAASPSNSGKNEIRIGCPTLMTIYLSGFSEAGRNMGKAIRFSHEWQSTPIHLVGCNIDLDRHTSGVVGAARNESAWVSA